MKQEYKSPKLVEIEIVLAEDNSKWYNPAFFAKVLLN